ncbi:MAG: hypothetical protein Q8O67_10615 [Deltaproteobacteria bacterium]|nr:hypothetical protein [Deltaproteobacteria bacterium]
MNVATLVLMLAAGADAPPPPALVSVSAVGEAALYGGDVVHATKEAQRDARRKALASGATALIQSNIILRNDSMMIDAIASAGKGVFSDDVWGEPAPGATGTTMTIALSAKVNLRVVEDAICTVTRQNHDPKVALVVVEKLGEDARWTTETVTKPLLKAAFVDACFTVVDDVIVTEVSAEGDLPPAAIDTIIKNSNAQYVVLAAARMRPGKDKPDVWAASVNVKMINTSTNEIEAVAFNSAPLPGTSATLAQAALPATIKEKLIPRIMDDLMKKVVQRWEPGDGPGFDPRLSLQVRGIKNFAAGKAFQATLKAIFPSAKLVPRVSKGDYWTYDLQDVDGGADVFANATDGKKVGKLFIEIIEVTRGKVILKLSPTPQP